MGLLNGVNFTEKYVCGLRKLVENSLMLAYELGRQAISENIELLHLVELHQNTLEEILNEASNPRISVQEADRFLFESLSAFEIVSRSFQDANNRLKALVETLEERNAELAETQEELLEAKKNLENRVLERTQKLQKVNEELKYERDFNKNLIDTAQAIILVLDTKGRIVSFNPYMEEISGYELQELKDRDWFTTFLPEGDRTRIRKVFSEAVNNIDIRGNINPIITKTGCLIEIEWLAKTLKDANDNVIGVLSIGQNITERKQMEKTLSKVEQIESLGLLAGGIAHDFNNLLVSILCNTNLAKKYVTSQNKGYKCLENSEKAVFQAKRLTRQLSAFSNGGLPFKEIISLRELIEDSAQFAISGSQIECKYYIDPDLWSVEIDRGQIGQVIHNLVINAREAMTSDGTIKIKAENTSVIATDKIPLVEGNYVKLTIKDEGIGISEKQLPKIFDPYFTDKKSGSGLGLTVTYSIIQKHNGSITVESEVGIGTNFSIYLLAAEEKSIGREKLEEDVIPGTGKILLMDDDVLVRESISNALKDIGYEVISAKEGNEAIELYRKAKESDVPFNAALLDLIVHRGLGGEKTITKLLEIDPEMIAIASSGYSNNPVMAKHKEYGFRDIAVKPYSLNSLSKLLHKLIGQSGKSIESLKIQEEEILEGARKILLMDDDDLVRDAVGSALSMIGYDVVAVENGEKAISAYQEAQISKIPFDAVIMDLTIHGGIGGKETIIKLQSIDPNVKAIASSGAPDDPVMKQFEKYGFREKVAKPYDLDDLINVLNAICAS